MAALVRRGIFGSIARNVRFMGGHGPAPKEAYFLGQAPGARVTEEWELPTYAFFLGGICLAFTGIALGPETRLSRWAQDELDARLDAKSRGEKIEYGQQYQVKAVRE